MMPCTFVPMPGGGQAIVCSRGPAQRCACGRKATLLCDWKVKDRRSGTCDKPLCRQCATQPADDKDLCPDHAAQWKARGRPSAPVGAAVQSDLFDVPAQAIGGGPGTPASGRS